MSEELTPKRGRGRPKGTGGNKRPDRTEAMSVHAEPGDNRRYIEHSMKMWDWPNVDMKEPAQVKERIGMYLSITSKKSWGLRDMPGTWMTATLFMKTWII